MRDEGERGDGMVEIVPTRCEKCIFLTSRTGEDGVVYHDVCNIYDIYIRPITDDLLVKTCKYRCVSEDDD